MRVRSSLKVVALQWTLVTAVIHPCLLAVLSMLKAWRGWIDLDGRRRSWTKEGSIKFPVALQSMRVLRGLRNQISSSAHSGVVRRHLEPFWTLGSSTSNDEKSVRLKSL